MDVLTVHIKWHAGHLHALERATVRSRTVAAPANHLGPPQHARRCTSASAARQLVGPLLLLPPLAPAHTRIDRLSVPVSTHTRAVPLAPLLSLFSLPSPWTDPTSTPYTSLRAPVVCSDDNSLAGA